MNAPNFTKNRLLQAKAFYHVTIARDYFKHLVDQDKFQDHPHARLRNMGWYKDCLSRSDALVKKYTMLNAASEEQREAIKHMEKRAPQIDCIMNNLVNLEDDDLDIIEEMTEHMIKWQREAAKARAIEQMADEEAA